MLGTFKIVASDDFKVKKGNHQFVYSGKKGKRSKLYLSVPWKMLRKTYKVVSDIEILEIASEETIQRAGGQAAWAIGGAILTGGIGLLAGAVLGRKRDMVTFICKLNDGKKFIGVMKKKEFEKLSTASGKDEASKLLDTI